MPLLDIRHCRRENDNIEQLDNSAGWKTAGRFAWRKSNTTPISVDVPADVERVEKLLQKS